MARDRNDGRSAPARTYEVGRGAPPEAHRFKPGESGNPKGRPPNTHSTQEEVKRLLDGNTTVSSHGRPKKMNRRQLLVAKLFERAVKGDNRASAILLQYDLGPAPSSNGEIEDRAIEMSADVDEILVEYVRRNNLMEPEK